MSFLLSCVLLNMLNFSSVCILISSFVSSLVSAGSRVAKRAAGTSAGPLAKMPKLIPLASSSVAGAVKIASVPLVAR